ncbi:hypothetical protein [Chlorogloeopsis sp. ULAP02]|uniref:hypothetical protein n=1 Tax=Chlorogloeopsis sp. ULAP02 TaxID=3107926 RepID=UPI003136BCCC
MSHRRFNPAFLGNLKTKLWNLSQPSFWGTAIFLSVVGLVVKEYLTHPDHLSAGQKEQVESQKSTDSSLSVEDRAIAADIDNLPVLFYDFEHADITPTASTPKKNTRTNENKGVSNDLSNATSNPGLKLANPAPVPKLENPFVVQAENLLQLKTFQSDRQFSIVNGVTTLPTQIGSGENSAFSQNTAPLSALQTAINRSASQNLPTGNNTSLTQMNSFERSLPNMGLTTQANTTVINGSNYNTVTATSQPQNSVTIPNNNLDSRFTNTQNQFPNNSVNLNSSQSSSGITPYNFQTPNRDVVVPSNIMQNNFDSGFPNQ